MAFGDTLGSVNPALQGFATSKTLNGPQLQQLISYLMAQMGISPDKKGMDIARIIGMTAINSFGDSLGLDNAGQQYTNIYSGLAANRRGFNLGGVMGRTQGHGYLTMGIADQIHEGVQQAFTNSEGGLHTGRTYGLDRNTMSRITAEQMKTYNFKDGDVTWQEFERKDMRSQLQKLAKEKHLDKDSSVYKLLDDVATVEEQRTKREDELRTVLGPQRWDKMSVSERKRRIDGMMRVDPTVNQEAYSNLQRMDEGTLNMPIVDGEVQKKIASGTAAVAKNVKALSELFGTKNLAEIQRNADALGMGSVTATANIKKVKDKLDRAQVQAAVSGRSVREVLAEQQAIMAGLEGVYGHGNVPTAAVEHVQRTRSQAMDEEAAGLSTGTADTRAAEAARSNANAEQNIMGMIMSRYVEKKYGGKMSKEAKQLFAKRNKAYEEAKAAGDMEGMKQIALEAEKDMRAMGFDVNDPETRAAALKAQDVAAGEEYADVAVTSDDGKVMQNVHSRWNKGKENLATAAGQWKKLGGTGESWDKLFKSAFKGFGSDQFALREATEKAAEISKLDPASRKARLEEERQRLIDSGLSKDVADAQVQYMRYMSRTDDDNARNMLYMEVSGRHGLDNSLNRARSSPTQQLAERKAADKLFRQQMEEGNKNYSEGILNDFIGGLVGNGGMTLEEAATAGILERMQGGKSVQQALKDENDKSIGFSIGAMDEKGRISENKVNELMQNDDFLEAMGVSKKSKKQKKQLRETLLGVGGASYINSKLSENYVATSVNGEAVFMDRVAAAETQREYDDVLKDSKFAGLIDVFGKGNFKYDKDAEEGKRLSVKAGKEGQYWSEDEVGDALRQALWDGDKDTRKAIEKAANEGNKEAKMALGMELANNAYALVGHLDEDAPQEGGVFGKFLTRNGEYREALDKAYSEVSSIDYADNWDNRKAFKKMKNALTGGHSIKALLDMDFAKTSGFVDKEGIIKTGAMAGQSLEEVQASLMETDEEGNVKYRDEVQALIDTEKEQETPNDLLSQILMFIQQIAGELLR